MTAYLLQYSLVDRACIVNRPSLTVLRLLVSISPAYVFCPVLAASCTSSVGAPAKTHTYTNIIVARGGT